MSAKSILENVTNLALLVVCALLVWFVFTHRDVFSHKPSRILLSESPMTGNVLAPLHDYNWSSHSATLVLAIREGCHFCEASMPFYRRLSDLERAGQLHVHLLTVMPDAAEFAAQHIHSMGVDVQGSFNDPLVGLNVSGTPTLLLIDAQGKIEKAWVGQLAQSQEKDVIDAIAK